MTPRLERLEALMSSIEREKKGKSRGDTKRSSEEEKEMGRIKEGVKSQILRILLRFKLAGLVKLKEGRDNTRTAPSIVGLPLAQNNGLPLVKTRTARSTTPTLPHSFPFFSPELCRLSQQPSVWNDKNQPSALTALINLADIVLILVYGEPFVGLNVSPEDAERRDTALIHLFPFLGPESQTQFLSSFGTFCKNMNTLDRNSLDRIVECLLEMATVNSLNTPIALLKEMRKVVELVFRDNHTTYINGRSTPHTAQFEQSTVEKLRTAEGEERWKLLTQLAVVSNRNFAFVEELMRAENNAQALLILSLPTIRSTRPNLHLETNPDAFDRVVGLAGHFNNIPLVAEAMTHIEDTIKTCIYQLPDDTLLANRRHTLRDLVFNTLQTIARFRREGVEEGCAMGKDEVTSQIVESCLKVLRFLMQIKSFDPTPVIDSLVSLAVTTDLSLLRSILLALQEIEQRTRDTPTPFSISRATAPFRGIHQSSVTQQPLPSIVAPILLPVSLKSLKTLARRNEIILKSRLVRSPFPNDQSVSITQHLPGLNENLLSDIAKATAQTVYQILEKRKVSSLRALKSDGSFKISIGQTVRNTTPQRLFLTVLKMIFPDNPTEITASTLLPFSPFLTRILTIVVPSSPDRVELRSELDEISQLLNSFLSLVLSLIHTGTSSTFSTPPLSSLLSVLSIALVRLDTIPSSLDLHSSFYTMFKQSENRSNPQVRQFVLTLCSEGMEDRRDVALDSFSLDFLNKWRGANAQRHVDRMMPNAFVFRNRLGVGINPPFRVLGHPVHQPPNRPPLYRQVGVVHLHLHQQPNHPPAPLDAPPVGGLGDPLQSRNQRN
ncbi:hypothetical protein BLNAU_20677 [Blattamonas nauphoetae]|uniref:Uncharacterized protein n=1 Tax=Blattamonas nauphoetae TaxID=2049346 RepID=A0ABQ9WY78_9EUKA|nr:hypothetical protein BLNAU_20677 [Blattamonas nauphoetae]